MATDSNIDLPPKVRQKTFWGQVYIMFIFYLLESLIGCFLT